MKKVYLAYPSTSQYIIESSQVKDSNRNLKVGNKTEILEEHCLMDNLFCLANLVVIYSPGPPSQGWYYLTCDGASYIKLAVKKLTCKNGPRLIW